MAPPLLLEPGDPRLVGADRSPEAPGVHVGLRAYRADDRHTADAPVEGGSDHRAYPRREVERRVRPVAEHLAYAVVPLAEQEAFLAAIGGWSSRCPSAEPVVVPHVWDRRRGVERSSAPGREMRQQFADSLARVLLSAFACQSGYDLALGIPRHMERHPLELRNRAQFWSLHRTARRTLTSDSAKS